MYSKDPISPCATATSAVATAAAQAIDSETAEARISLDQLRSVVVELSIALNETLRDERSNAAACLERATTLLHGTSSRPTEKVARSGLAPWQARRVLAHIEANLTDTIRNKDLAAIARLSEFYFNVAFRNTVGESPHRYIIRRRVERAQGLLLSTDMPLCDIASLCGMADQPHLTRMFRRIVGESPGVWRRARANPVD
jgi:AraC family transcriptional regulator